MDTRNHNKRRRIRGMATLVKESERVNFIKPNLHLKGKKGRRMLSLICALPEPSTKRLSNEVDHYIEEALRRRRGD